MVHNINKFFLRSWNLCPVSNIYKSNTILCLNFTCYFSKFRIWLWAFFMWTLNECLVLEVLLQMWQISSGRITCFASICLVTSILLDFVWPQMLQTHWFSTLEQLASTKKGSWSCVISTLPGTSRSIIIQNVLIAIALSCVCYFSANASGCVFFMWIRRECLVLEGLLQIAHNSSGKITCFDSMCLLTSILFKKDNPQIPHIQRPTVWSL